MGPIPFFHTSDSIEIMLKIHYAFGITQEYRRIYTLARLLPLSGSFVFASSESAGMVPISS